MLQGLKVESSKIPSDDKYHLKKICERARHMLFTNSTNYFTEKAPPELNFSQFNYVAGYYAEYFDSSDFTSLLQVNRKANAFVLEHKKIALHAFNSYLVFEEDWFNAVVFKIMDDNSLTYLTSDSDETKDCVILMVLKYAFRDIIKLKIPRYIYLGIISFIFEIIFGAEIQLPINNEAQMIHFLGEMVQDNNLPKSLNYFIGILNLPFEEQKARFSCIPNQGHNADAIKLLEFLAVKPKPSFLAHLEFQNANNISTYENVQDYLLAQRSVESHAEFDYNFLDRFQYKICPCTTTLWDQILIKDRLIAFIEFSWIGPYLYKNFNMRSEIDIKNYIWSLDYENPFSVERLEELGMRKWHIDVLLSANIPFILKLDLIEKITRNRSDPYKIMSFKNSPIYEVYEMLLVEDLVPKNLDNFYFHLCIIESKFQSKYRENYVLIFENLFPKNNPLAPLMVLGCEVKSFKEEILGKFDLNVTYEFGEFNPDDSSFSHIRYTLDNTIWVEMNLEFGIHHFLKEFKSLSGSTMTFRDILDHLNQPELFETYLRFSTGFDNLRELVSGFYQIQANFGLAVVLLMIFCVHNTK